MKVFFVGSSLEGCYNVRCLFPLQTLGFDGDRTTFLAYRMTPENKALAAKESDIVVFHRPQREGKIELAKLLKENGKKIVFDNDDTVKDDGGFRFNEYIDEERMKQGLKKLNDHTDEFIALADLVTCSTEFLAEEYRKINPNVIVLPNCIDPFYFPEPYKNDGDKVRIGVTGSVGITSDIEVLKPILEHYRNDKRVQLVLFSLPPAKDDKITRELYFEEYKFWDGIDIEWQPFVPAEEYYDMLNSLHLDMIIIPRADNYFNRCKSNLKFLENSMLEIPSVCQTFPTGDSPYQQNPADAEYMLQAGNTQEFIDQMEKLITNKEFRTELGEKARKYVEENYNINDKASLWREAYETLYENNRTK